LNDRASADQVVNKVMKMSAVVPKDTGLSGFIANEEKIQWVPSQVGELLVLYWTYKEFFRSQQEEWKPLSR